MTALHTTAFEVSAIPPADLARIRANGVDDFGHPLRPQVNTDELGAPLRCCLREARVGEVVTLMSWQPLREAPDSVYAEVGPVFVHAEECPGYQAPSAYPEEFRHRTQVLRSYSADGHIHDAAIASGTEAEETIARLLADRGAVVVHSRNVKAGCYMFAVRRTGTTAA